MGSVNHEQSFTANVSLATALGIQESKSGVNP
jgi:hypothetical protein